MSAYYRLPDVRALQEMINAHVESVLALAEPFRDDIYDFGHENITARIRAHIPTILQHRKTAPPSESYSLNRKLSGCFLLCANLGSRVRCQSILQNICATTKCPTRGNKT